MRSRRVQGFSLLEMLFIVMMLGIAALLTGRLFKASITTLRIAHDSADQNASSAHLLTTLRRDVWNSTRVESVSAAALTLLQADGSSIRWSFSAGHARRAMEGEPAADWSSGGTIGVRREGAMIVVLHALRPNDLPDDIRFICPVLATDGVQQ